MPKWECTKCGTVHRSNPDKCTECSHTVLIQHRDSSFHFRFNRPSPSSNPNKSTKGQYYCKKCGYVHDRKPFVCEERGASTLAPYDIPPLQIDADGQPPAGDHPR